MFCRFCGADLPSDSTFCQSCGKSLAISSSVSSSAGIAAAPATAPISGPATAQPESRRAIVVGISLGVAVIIVAVVAFVALKPKGTPTANPSPQPVQASPNIAPTPSASQLPAEISTEDLFKHAAPSVVLIEVFKSTGERFGTGSGFVAGDGTVVTNYHVIRGAYAANVRFQDGSTIPVRGVGGFDQYRDVAVVKADNLSAKPLVLGDSEKAQIGDRVIAIGSPLAIKNTLSDGIISGIRNGLIQTSAPISPGSSGGPLFNKRGEVVGIIVAQINGAQNLNFAVPINWAKGFLQSADLTSLGDLARQNTVEQQIVGSTLSVPAHQRRAYTIVVDRNHMADPKLDGTFSSAGGFGGEIRVYVAMGNELIYDSGRTTSGTIHVPLFAGRLPVSYRQLRVRDVSSQRDSELQISVRQMILY